MLWFSQKDTKANNVFNAGFVYKKAKRRFKRAPSAGFVYKKAKNVSKGHPVQDLSTKRQKTFQKGTQWWLGLRARPSIN